MNRLFAGTWRKLIGYFLAGVFALLPLVITVGIVIWLVGFLNNIVGPETLIGTRIKELSGVDTNDIVLPYILGWIIVLIFIFVIGVLVESGLRKFLQGIVEMIINRLPLVGSLYNTASQLVGMLDKKDEGDLKGMSVVFAVFGKENGSGILALMPTPEKFEINGVLYQVIYVPTSPIPMTGGVLFMPCHSIQEVDMSVDGLMSIYLSMGVTGPQFLPTEKPKD
ncbi:MAG: DUF502 domain-containing protein [Pirellulales bacterium]|jgi:uncharacterized membrane protein